MQEVIRMYAIIRQGNGAYYTCAVFGYYRISDDPFDGTYWVVLNSEKNKLIMQNGMQQNTRYLIPMVLITDADTSGWKNGSGDNQAAGFLPVEDLPAMIAADTVPPELTRTCVELDRSYHYEEVHKVRTAEDLRNLQWTSRDFHDAHIARITPGRDSLEVLFDGVWGCRILLRFSGEVSWDASSRDPARYDPYWMGSTLLQQDGFIYLIDDSKATVEDIDSSYCWFRARNMEYRIIPD